jgi:hypothetical protein
MFNFNPAFRLDKVFMPFCTALRTHQTAPRTMGRTVSEHPAPEGQPPPCSSSHTYSLLERAGLHVAARPCPSYDEAPILETLSLLALDDLPSQNAAHAHPLPSRAIDPRPKAACDVGPPLLLPVPRAPAPRRYLTALPCEFGLPPPCKPCAAVPFRDTTWASKWLEIRCDHNGNAQSLAPLSR